MKTLAINILSIGSADISSRLIGLIAITYLARILGPENIGILSIGMAIFTYASIISTMGLPSIGVRSISTRKSSTTHLVKQIITARCFLSTFSFVLGLGIIMFWVPNQNIRNICILYLFSLFPSALMLEWLFQGYSKMKTLAIGRSLGMITYLLIIIGIVSNSQDIYWVPFAWCAGLFVQAVYLWISYKIYCTPDNYSEQHLDLFKIIKEGLPIGISGLISHSVIQFPIIYLGFFSTAENTGIFSVAFRFVIFLLVLDRVFYAIFFPTISKTYKDSIEKLEKHIIWSLKIVTNVSLFVAVILFMMGGDIISIIFGSQYHDSILIFKILLFYFILTFNNSVFTFTLIGIEKEHLYTKSISFGAALFILIFLLPISLPPTIIVAIALAVNEGASMIMMVYYLRKSISINFISRIFLPLSVYLIFSLHNYLFKSYFSTHTTIIIIFSTLFAIAISTGINRNDINTLKYYIK